MFKFATPIILIILSIAGFFMFIAPSYNDISTLKVQADSYNQALDNSKTLEAERDKLTQKYNNIDPDNLVKIQKLLPDNVDNIRIILEIEKIASPYGMVLKDVKYDTISQATTTATSNTSTTTTSSGNKDYGTWNLEFSTQGTYANFLSFIKDIESNLRIVDISSIQFSSDTTGSGSLSSGASIGTPNDVYKYDFKIKTYWLKG